MGIEKKNYLLKQMKSLYLIVALICLVSVISATPVCKGCAGTSAGPCKNPSNNVCYDYQSNTDCYSGTNECPDEGTYYSCVGGTCAPNATGIFPTEAICEDCCQHCTGCKLSEGNCMNKDNNVCHYYNDFNEGQPGEEYCFPESCKRYECSSTGSCSQTSNGTYYSMDSCGSACSATSTKYACNNGNCAESASGTYASKEICESDCTVAPTKYACDSNTNKCAESTTGYSSMDECNNACTSTTKNYACNSGVCSESTTGTYDSMETCAAGCSSTGGKKYKCHKNTCIEDPSGSYPSMDNCVATCQTGTVYCTGCWVGSIGMCIAPDTVCYNNTNDGKCPSQLKPCHASEEQFLGY